MQIPRHIFKAYDVRGLIDDELTPELCTVIGRAFATLLRKENPEGALKVAVGRDMRESSPAYQAAVVEGLRMCGVDVVDIGLVSTPAFYFGVGDTGADGGVMVSASHNPAEYNGCKFVRAKAVPVSGDGGIYEMADTIEKEAFVESDARGELSSVEGVPEKFVNMSIDFAEPDPISKFKVAIDTANGMGAQYLDDLLTHLDLDVTKMYWELDGTFPNHEANPFKYENNKDLEAKIVEVGADVGIATDGDGDRIFFFDELGKMIDPAIVRGVIAQVVLRSYPGAAIGYDIRPGKITQDLIEEAGGKPFVTRVGHSLIKERMIEKDAVFSGESSGHFYYRYDTGSYDGPVTVAVQFLQELTRSGMKASEFVGQFERYVHSGEINFEVEDKTAMIEKIKQHFADGEFNDLDGISITYDDFWFNVRPSNTESLLRLNLEAVDQATMEQRRDEIIALIQE